jgi:hypothetical protein
MDHLAILLVQKVLLKISHIIIKSGNIQGGTFFPELLQPNVMKPFLTNYKSICSQAAKG